MNYIQCLHALNKADLIEEIDRQIADSSHLIVQSEEVARAIEETNGSDWEVDDFELIHIDLGEEECVVQITFSAGGGPNEDPPYNGDRIYGEAEGILDARAKIRYQIITAMVADEDEEAEMDEGF